MTYQEILEEFAKRRASEFMMHQSDPANPMRGIAVSSRPNEVKIADLEWAIQSILEKLRDSEGGLTPEELSKAAAILRGQA